MLFLGNLSPRFASGNDFGQFIQGNPQVSSILSKNLFREPPYGSIKKISGKIGNDYYKIDHNDSWAMIVTGTSFVDFQTYTS